MHAQADEVTVRPASPGDLDAMVAVTAEAFGPSSSIDCRIESVLGRGAGPGWVDLKARALRRELSGRGGASFVAELGGRVVGYVTSVVDEAASRGTIANLAVAPHCAGRGVGRKLLLRSLERFRELGLARAKIETLATNEVGQHLYPAVGFREVARQIHYVMRLR